MLLVLSLLFTLLLLLFSLSILLLLKALLWLLVLLVLLFPHFAFTDVFVLLLFVLFFSLHVMNCYFLSSFSFAFYFFVLFCFCFILFCFFFTSDEKTILFTWLTFQVKVCKLLCFFVYLFACLFSFLKWNRRVKIHNLIAFLQLTKGF